MRINPNDFMEQIFEDAGAAESTIEKG